jgi:hypothetical protein
MGNTTEQPRLEIGRKVVGGELAELVEYVENLESPDLRVTTFKEPLLRYMASSVIQRLIRCDWSMGAFSVPHSQEPYAPAHLTSPEDIVERLSYSSLVDGRTAFKRLDAVPVLDWNAARFSEARMGVALTIGDLHSDFYLSKWLLQGESSTLDRISSSSVSAHARKMSKSSKRHYIMLAELSGRGITSLDDNTEHNFPRLPHTVSLAAIGVVERLANGVGTHPKPS